MFTLIGRCAVLLRKTYCFRDISLQKVNILVCWNGCSESSKVTADVANGKVSYGFLLVMHSNFTSKFNCLRNIAIDRCKMATFASPSIIPTIWERNIANIFAIFFFVFTADLCPWPTAYHQIPEQELISRLDSRTLPPSTYWAWSLAVKKNGIDYMRYIKRQIMACPIWVRGHLMSLKMTPFDRPYTTLY